MGPEREEQKLLPLPENTLNLYWKTIGLYKNRKHFLKADFILKSLSSLETLHGHEKRWASLRRGSGQDPDWGAHHFPGALSLLSIKAAWEDWPRKAKASA